MEGTFLVFFFVARVILVEMRRGFSEFRVDGEKNVTLVEKGRR